MGKILSSTVWTNHFTESPLSFEIPERNWFHNRYLLIKGERAYHIGGSCDTCAFLFERLGGTTHHETPKMISSELEQGLSTLDPSIIEKVAPVLPSGNYFVSLQSLQPSLVCLGGENDYFTHEEVELWGVEGFWGLPHYPKVKYYRGITSRLSAHEMLFEFLVPMFPQNWLDEDRIEEYRAELAKDRCPTALSLSIFDIHEPADFDDTKEITAHWCLSHYLLDGHHKVQAAYLENKPITLLSFLSINQSLCDETSLERLRVMFSLDK